MATPFHQTYQLLTTGILGNPVISKLLPAKAVEYARRIKFEGSQAPAIPVNWRLAESIGVLKATEAIMMNALLEQKYGEPQDIMVNIDHAQLFMISCLLTTIKTDDQASIQTEGFATTSIFPSCDIHRNSANAYRCSAANIYPTKDGRFYHVHSNLNPNLIQDALGLPHDIEDGANDFDVAHKIYQEKVIKYTVAELDELCNKKLKVSGTTAWSVNEYLESEHGKANADRQLWNIQEFPNPDQPPCWWPSSKETSISRPLAGLKVVDFSRIIAAPTLTRGLAEYGASIMRVTSSHLPDMGFLHPDMGWGKWNTSLDLRKSADLQKAKELILEADVVVYGYRPEVLSKYGLGYEDVLELCQSRNRGIIIARLDCYGWVGPWAHRSGWQQISDACCGVSLEFGRAMHGRDEPVTPIFPNSDHCAGLAGHFGVISALLKRAEKGGSYVVDCSINSYSHWLVQSVGTYPQSVWEQVWSRHGRRKFRHYHPMQYLFPEGIKMLKANTPYLLNPDFFEDRDAKAMGCKVNCVKPVLKFPSGKVQLRFHVGTRTNGIDQPKWPSDLLAEVVTA
ncbi:CoA-transferase family III domain-containing protein [Xylogone sp. PMI_703]|nr:CoA-transferase family III domain-containing protein [Xylogone sp. PMI_703]